MALNPTEIHLILKLWTVINNHVIIHTFFLHMFKQIKLMFVLLSNWFSCLSLDLPSFFLSVLFDHYVWFLYEFHFLNSGFLLSVFISALFVPNHLSASFYFRILLFSQMLKAFLTDIAGTIFYYMYNEMFSLFFITVNLQGNTTPQCLKKEFL